MPGRPVWIGELGVFDITTCVTLCWSAAYGGGAKKVEYEVVCHQVTEVTTVTLTY